MKKNIAIIGAGFGGLAAAYDHLKAGNTVTIYESTDQVAGLAAGFKEPHWDWSIERFYHHWFASDQHMLGLIAELGWSDRVIFQRPLTVIYWEGKFHPFDSIFSNIPLFLLKHFSLIDVIRYGSVGAYLRFSPIWKPLEKETAAGWTRRWFGRHIFETQWGPLLDSKFGEKNARQVNMAWLWARLHSRTTRLGTFQGGFQAFADAFAARLREMGAQIRLSAPVTEVRAGIGDGNGNGCVEVISKGETAVYDQCLVTTSPGLLAHMAPGLPADYLHGLLDLKHMGAVVMVVSLKRQLSEQGYYWFNLPKSAGFPFLALVEHTNFVDPVHFGGDHLVYAGDYLENDHEYFNLSQEELLKRFLPAFEKINPQFKPDWVKKTWLFKSNYAQPIPMVNHSANIPAIQTPIPGLFFASMSQVYPWDRGTNFAVEIARRAAKLMLSDSHADIERSNAA